MAHNAGPIQRWENGGVLKIGGTAVSNVVPGTLRWRRIPREVVSVMDRGDFSARIPGDKRPQEIEFETWATTLSEASSDLIDTLLPAYSSGQLADITIVIERPDYDGASTGKRWTFSKCVLVDGLEDQTAGSGQGADTRRFRIMSYEGPVDSTAY